MQNMQRMQQRLYAIRLGNRFLHSHVASPTSSKPYPLNYLVICAFLLFYFVEVASATDSPTAAASTNLKCYMKNVDIKDDNGVSVICGASNTSVQPICVRYEFLGTVIAGCFPKTQGDLDTCTFIRSFADKACCCHSDNCNTKLGCIDDFSNPNNAVTSTPTKAPTGTKNPTPNSPTFKPIIAAYEYEYGNTVKTSSPTRRPTTSAPGSTPRPTTLKPTTGVPTTLKPTTANPSSGSATPTARPTTLAPGSTLRPTTASPSKPTTKSPTFAPVNEYEPVTSAPTRRPTTSAPAGTAKPTTTSPTTQRPTTGNPSSNSSSSPTTNKPTTAKPTTASPAEEYNTDTFSPTVRPTTAKPNTGRPTTKTPTLSPFGEYEEISTAPTRRPTTGTPTTTAPSKRPTTKAPTIPDENTDAPTPMPSPIPTVIPTVAPNLSPNTSPPTSTSVKEMDVYIHADMSRSISMANPQCIKDSGIKCWDLQVKFATDLQTKLATQLGGYYDPNSGSPNGLRYWLSTFTCKDGKPITTILTPLTGSKSDIDAALVKMAKLKPYLGTCPTQGLNFVLNSIQEHTGDIGRLNKAVIIITDGRFDDPDSTTASPVTKKIMDYQSEVFAVAVGKGIDTQQLKEVTHDQSGSRIVNIDSFSVLALSASQVAQFAIKFFDKPTAKPTPLRTTPKPNPRSTLPPTNDFPTPSPTKYPTSFPTLYPTGDGIARPTNAPVIKGGQGEINNGDGTGNEDESASKAPSTPTTASITPTTKSVSGTASPTTQTNTNSDNSDYLNSQGNGDKKTEITARPPVNVTVPVVVVLFAVIAVAAVFAWRRRKANAASAANKNNSNQVPESRLVTFQGQGMQTKADSNKSSESHKI